MLNFANVYHCSNRGLCSAARMMPNQELYYNPRQTLEPPRTFCNLEAVRSSLTILPAGVEGVASELAAPLGLKQSGCSSVSLPSSLNLLRMAG